MEIEDEDISPLAQYTLQELKGELSRRSRESSFLASAEQNLKNLQKQKEELDEEIKKAEKKLEKLRKKRLLEEKLRQD
jgi:uncharacterized protein YlxW (UPF0749 family)